MVDNEDFDFSERLLIRVPYFSFEAYSPERLTAVLADPVFRDALWLASPELFRELERRGFDYGLLDAGKRKAVCKYYNRMCFRPTPFGLFASFGLTRWEQGGRISLGIAGDARLHLLPSLAWITALTARNAANQRDVKLAANPGLYRVGGNWRYAAAQPDAAGKYLFSLQELDAVDANNFILERLSQGPVSRENLIALLCTETGCDLEEGSEYIDFLVSEQVLLPETGRNLIGGGVSGMARDLAKFWERLGPVRVAELGSLPGIAEALRDRSAAAGLTTVAGGLFYAALERNAVKGGVRPGVKRQIKEGLYALQRLVLPTPGQFLPGFREAFTEKFGDREVPLLLALDPDTGVGFGNLHRDTGDYGFVQEIRFAGKNAVKSEMAWTPVHRMFLRTWLQHTGRGLYDPVLIGDDDLDGLEDLSGSLRLPPSMAVVFGLTEKYLVLDTLGGASATALAGRFTVFSGEVSALCREIAAQEMENNPGVIFAEIHQLSHEQVDNVNRRNPVYDQVISVNTYLHRGVGEQLLPADLLVAVVDDEVILRSARSGSRIVPRLPTAYNFHHNDLALFRFLCELQYQGLRADLGFDPEKLFPGMEFYPRIVYRDIILSLARWHLRKEDIAMLGETPHSLGRLHLFCKEKGIPPLISLGRSDQQLVFNLANDGEAILFLSCLNDPGDVVIREYLAAGEEVSDGKNRYAAQFIALMTQKRTVYRPCPPGNAVLNNKVQRSFPPGSEWLYMKIYSTPQRADQVLLDIVQPFLDRHVAVVGRWFFIRYQDPAPHIRLRLQTADAEAAVLQAELQDLLASAGSSGLVRRFVADTYEREIERYGADLITGVEDCFHAGSAWTIGFLQQGGLNRRGGPEVLPFVLVYRMCTTLLPDREKLGLFLNRIKNNFLTEFKGNERLHIDFDNRYRELAGPLRALIERGATPVTGSEAEGGVLESLNRLVSGAVKFPDSRCEKLLADLVHLQVNRVFANRQRQHEALVWYCLYKYETSLAARSRATAAR